LSHALIVLAVILVGVLLWAASPVVTVVFVAWLLFATGGYVIGAPKGRGVAGIVLGTLTGPLGLFIVAKMRPSDAVQARANV
jgi:hypothetical protein